MLKFKLGSLCISRAVNDSQNDIQDILSLLQRHAKGDWGHMRAKEIITNTINATTKGMVISSFDINETIVTIITYNGHQKTEILLDTEVSALPQ